MNLQRRLQNSSEHNMDTKAYGEITGTWAQGEYGFGTDIVHAAVAPDPASGAILTPICQATTFVQVHAEFFFSFRRGSVIGVSRP